jgi:hypothetical protein
LECCSYGVAANHTSNYLNDEIDKSSRHVMLLLSSTSSNGPTSLPQIHAESNAEANVLGTSASNAGT